MLRIMLLPWVYGFEVGKIKSTKSYTGEVVTARNLINRNKVKLGTIPQTTIITI